MSDRKLLIHNRQYASHHVNANPANATGVLRTRPGVLPHRPIHARIPVLLHHGGQVHTATMLNHYAW
jgi:hypothetical protein